jgi:hypothetical protein
MKKINEKKNQRKNKLNEKIKSKEKRTKMFSGKEMTTQIDIDVVVYLPIFCIDKNLKIIFSFSFSF